MNTSTYVYDTDGNIVSERTQINPTDYVVKMYDTNQNIKEEKWFKNGLPYREDGPAWIGYYSDGKTVKYEAWYTKFGEGEPVYHGLFHRNDGPAWIYYNPDGKTVREQYWFKEGERA